MQLLKRNIYIVAMILALFLVMPYSALASTPTEQVREKADKVLKILNDPALKNNKEKRRDMVTNIVEEMIDWQEVGRRALAIHWRKRTPEERKEFTTLFRDLLKRTYSDKLDLYAGESIIYDSEKIEGTRAVVKTRMINKKKGEEATVEYRLIKKGDQWLGYDLVIEGISAVNNYRVQFNEVIINSSYENLIKKMKNREFRIKEGSKDSKGSKKQE
jgi:phospholipid transport system substrate-binding protein